MKLLGYATLIMLVAFAFYVMYLIHTYPTRKLAAIRIRVQRLDELTDIEIFAGLNDLEQMERMKLLNELKELLDE